MSYLIFLEETGGVGPDFHKRRRSAAGKKGIYEKQGNTFGQHVCSGNQGDAGTELAGRYPLGRGAGDTGISQYIGADPAARFRGKLRRRQRKHNIRRPLKEGRRGNRNGYSKNIGKI